MSCLISHAGAMNKNKRKFHEFQHKTVGHAPGGSILTTHRVCQTELINV